MGYLPFSGLFAYSGLRALGGLFAFYMFMWVICPWYCVVSFLLCVILFESVLCYVLVSNEFIFILSFLKVWSCLLHPCCLQKDVYKSACLVIFNGWIVSLTPISEMYECCYHMMKKPKYTFKIKKKKKVSIFIIPQYIPGRFAFRSKLYFQNVQTFLRGK